MPEEYKSRVEKRTQRKKAPRQAAAPKTKKQKKGSAKTSILKRIIIGALLFGLVLLIGGIGLFAYYVKDTPEIDAALLKDPISSRVNDNSGELLTNLGDRREYVEYKDVPVLVRDAFVATEDSRFFEHKGIDPFRLASAAVKNVTDGFGSQGASTITQQVVKMSFLSPDKTLKRKAQEAWLAHKLEQQYSKEEIFEMYVNKVFMSGGINGIKAAADYYFGKPLDELTLPEAAYIAGVPQSPNNYNAFEHPEKAENRKDIVLSLMNQHEKISAAEMEEAQSQNITDFLTEEPIRKTGVDKEFDAFMDQVIEEVEKMGYNPYTDGLTIETTLDRDAQLYMYELLNSEEYIDYPSENLQAGIVLTDTQTGAIQAIGGGRNQEVQRGFNYAVDNKTQPGSTIKPILDYGPAIEYLNWSTYEQVEDSPLEYSNGGSVSNAGGAYAGVMSMRDALARSKNTPAVRTFQEVGFDNAYEFAGKLGIPLKAEHESYAIGGMDGKEGISPLQMAGAYAAFGNGGIYNKPHTVKKIVLADGTEVKNDVQSEPAMSDHTAYMITDMLKSVLDYGTGTAADIPDLHVAGKTGTTNYSAEEREQYNIPSSASPDAWFVGYTTNYTAAIWTGYEKRQDYLSKESQQIAKKLFKELMTEVSKDVETPDFEKPDSVVELPIIKGSNPARIAGEGVSDSEKTYELFVRGEQPKRSAPVEKEPEQPEEEPEEEQQEQTESGEISSLNASADASGNMFVSWSYSGSDNASFSVSNGLETQSASGSSATLGGGSPGQTYTITVSAIVDGESIDSASTSVTIPGGQSAEPEEPEQPEQPEEQEQPEQEKQEEPAQPAPTPEPETEEPAEPAPAPEEPAAPSSGNSNGSNGNENSNGNSSGNNGNGSSGGASSSNGSNNAGNSSGREPEPVEKPQAQTESEPEVVPDPSASPETEEEPTP